MLQLTTNFYKTRRNENWTKSKSFPNKLFQSDRRHQDGGSSPQLVDHDDGSTFQALAGAAQPSPQRTPARLAGCNRTPKRFGPSGLAPARFLRHGDVRRDPDRGIHPGNVRPHDDRKLEAHQTHHHEVHSKVNFFQPLSGTFVIWCWLSEPQNEGYLRLY